MLPPGQTVESFTDVVEQFESVVGNDYVKVDAASLMPYNKLMIPEEDANHSPAGVVSPSTREEVQQLMVICNDNQIPIWPISLCWI